METSNASEKIAPMHGEVDAALEYLQQEGTAIMTNVDERKLIRKIDWMIMPLMFCTYNIQYLDKTLLNYVAVYPQRCLRLVL